MQMRADERKRMTMEASQKKEQTLQWDLTRTQMEPSIRTEVEDTVSY